MPNAPLRVGCPVCSGTGRVSYLRTGEWINKWCPGSNGPCDDDSRPNNHGLDNSGGKRKARIEYKRPAEAVTRGQDIHLSSELRSVRSDWKAIVVLVTDEGQTSAAANVKFRWKTNSPEDMPWQEADECAIDALGQRIAQFVWPALAVAA